MSSRNEEEVSLGHSMGASRGEGSTMQRSPSPTQMLLDGTTVHYTRTGRISKAKKGLKVYHCECGRVRYICLKYRAIFRALPNHDMYQRQTERALMESKAFQQPYFLLLHCSYDLLEELLF